MADKMSKLVLPVKNPSTGATTNKEFEFPGSKKLVAFTGTGTTGEDKGSEVSPRYIPGKWVFNADITVADGEVYFIKIPIVGSKYGVWLSLDNGAHYYPLTVSSGTALFTTQYGANTVIAVTYESAGTCSCYAFNGGDAKETITGIIRVLNDYDSGNTNTYVAQANTTTNADYRVLFSNSANDTTETKGARKNANLKYNPSTGNLQTTKLNGVDVGNNPKFTDTWRGIQDNLTSDSSSDSLSAKQGKALKGLIDNCALNYVDELPYAFYYGSAVVFNNEIHILGGNDGNFMGTTKHCKWNGSSWVSVSTLPYDFMAGSAVVYNNGIHILGPDKSHYKWNGSSWVSVSTLPYEFYNGSAVVYNDEIHILGPDKSHYKWNGSSWVSVSTLPYRFGEGSAVVYNNEIHILGSANHYKWNGSSWASVSTLPYNFIDGSAVVYNDEIHILGAYYERPAYYKWNGTSWSEVSTLPYVFIFGSAVVYNNEIHILGGVDESGFVGFTYHYKWNDSSWANKFPLTDPDSRYVKSDDLVPLSRSEIEAICK